VKRWGTCNHVTAKFEAPTVAKVEVGVSGAFIRAPNASNIAESETLATTGGLRSSTENIE
jgi:hypothetical protein